MTRQSVREKVCSKDIVNFIPKFVLIGACLMTFIVILTSVTSNHWASSKIHYESRGLWKFCHHIDDDPDKDVLCPSLNNASVVQIYEKRPPTTPIWLREGYIPDWLMAVRSTMIMAAVFEFIATMAAVFTLFIKQFHGYIASIFSSVAFALLLVGVYLFADRTNFSLEEYACGVGWGMGFLSVVFSFLSAFIGLCTF